MSKNPKWCYANCFFYFIIFVCILAIPLFTINTEKNAKSDLDNRILTEFPEFGSQGFENNVETYLQDRIGFRNQMVTGYQIINDALLGELTHPLYTYGQDDYIFFKMHDNVEYGEYHKLFAEAVAKIQQYCESRGAKFYFLLDPEKISVYRRYLPLGVSYNDEWIDELLSYMGELGVTCVNNRDILIEKSYGEQVFNQQYDAGHWNDLGAYYGTNNLLSTISKDIVSMKEYTLEDFSVSTTVGEYLANSRFPVFETVPSFSLKTNWDDITDHYSRIRINNSFPFFSYCINKAQDADQYPKMMVFQGSYYNGRTKFFIGRSSEYIGIHDYQNIFNLNYYFNIFQPDVVVFEAAEYTFVNRYFDSEKMMSIDFNPSLYVEGNDAKESLNSLISNAEKTNLDIALICERGDGFDTVWFDVRFPEAKYIYLISNGIIIDIIKDSEGLCITDIPHEILRDSVIIYYISDDGKRHYSEIPVQFK